jgi:hypothetical protein
MTTIPFGPQLVGETEKALGSLLRRELEPTGLDERRWVVLRLALQRADAPDGATGLADHVTARVRFDDASDLVADLRARGLLAGDAPTAAGRDLVADVQGRVGRVVGPVLAALPAADAAAAARSLGMLRDAAVGALGGPDV